MRIVVPPWERVLRYRDGVFVEELGPGVHRRGRWRARHVRVDVRPRLLTLPAQEVLTADGLAVKVSLLARRHVARPQVWHEVAAEPEALLYAALQLALRDAVAARPYEGLLAERSRLGPLLGEAVRPAAAGLGLALEDVAVRDLMAPAELRRAATEVATARAAGQAALERARGEVAATRALANAARTVADNPALLHLRTLQAVESGRATVVLAGPGAGGLSLGSP